jgi:diketogulonate reductase-like aldo/keto reductase
MAVSTRSITDALPIQSVATIARVPQLGFGTFQCPPEVTVTACLTALHAGYRHIDTAQYYENEAEVGEAIRRSGLAREDVFVTTKILVCGKTPEATYASCLESVGRIGGEGGGYVDCFLIHSPSVGEAKRREMWLALERLYREGRARAIGVSNFGKGHIEGLRGAGEIWPPHVNQIEAS